MVKWWPFGGNSDAAGLTEAPNLSFEDPDLDLPSTGGGSPFYRRLTRGERELPEYNRERALANAYKLYDANNLAKRMLEETRDYVLGGGVEVVATGDSESDVQAVQDVIDGFWHDPLNQLDIKLHDKVLAMGVAGEACWTAFVNPADGHVRLGYVDPADIRDVVTNPDNVEDVWEVLVKPAEVAGEPRRLKVVRVNEEAGAGDLMFRLTAASEGEANREGKPYDGSCFFWAINKMPNATRGRSDLLSNLDWVDAYDEMLFSELDRMAHMKAFIWDVTLTGADEPRIKTYLEKNGPPKPNTVRAHNEGVKWEAVTPDLKAVDAQAHADLIMSHIATGSGLPKTWLNGLMDVNRATAQELGEPAFKRLAARQKFVRYMLGQVVNFVLDQAEITGKLKRRENVGGTTRPVPWGFAITMPELRAKDMTATASTFAQTTIALATALADNLVDTQVAQEILAMVVSELGYDVDLDSMRTRIDEEKANEPPPPPAFGFEMEAPPLDEEAAVAEAQRRLRMPENGRVKA